MSICHVIVSTDVPAAIRSNDITKEVAIRGGGGGGIPHAYWQRPQAMSCINKNLHTSA